jgi:two-component system chemotaxis sensor kinase CheA
LRAQEEGRPSTLSETAIRVNVERLDELMNLVGELVLARNEILQFEPAKKDLGFHATVQRLNLITTELQEEVMKTRMQPIATIWDRFPPMVRSLANACGKPVRVEMDGRDTELDKTLVEAIKDPLTAVIRNAVDHGIEPPEVRASSGKPREGRLSLRGYQEGGQINIEISDDGSGIDIEKVKAKAVEQGLVSPERIDCLSDREILQLIFAPSLSTAEQVSNVSGRGVGMDVVKTNIERIGGTVEVESHRGQGTTLKIRIPLTLAIIPALITTCEGQRYAIPQRNLLELVRIDGNRKGRGIEFVQGTPVYRLRGRLLPLVFLSEVLGVPDERPAKNSAGDETRVFNVVVLLANGEQFGLVVDDVSHAQEIVVKPLGRPLERINCFGGATIMGDGQVALILDVRGLAERAGVLSEDRAHVIPHMASAAREADDNQEMLLVFSAGKDRQMAIPLSTVHRVEEFETSALEYLGDRLVVQYRGGILALIDLANLLEPGNAPVGNRLTVVVCSIEGRLLGLFVEEILDVADFPPSFESCAGEQGVLGSAIVGGRVTSLIDLAARVRTFYPELLQQPERQMGA